MCVRNDFWFQELFVWFGTQKDQSNHIFAYLCTRSTDKCQRDNSQDNGPNCGYADHRVLIKISIDYILYWVIQQKANGTVKVQIYFPLHDLVGFPHVKLKTQYLRITFSKAVICAHILHKFSFDDFNLNSMWTECHSAFFVVVSFWCTRSTAKRWGGRAKKMWPFGHSLSSLVIIWWWT